MLTTPPRPGRRARAALALVALLAIAPGARADDDGDDGGGGGAAGGSAGGGGAGEGGGSGRSWTGGGRMDLGPNPGRIAMPPGMERTLGRLFGAPAPAPAASGPGAPRADIVAAGLTPAALARLRREGFGVAAEGRAAGLARLRAPAGLTEAQALARLRAAAPGAVADRNHRYRLASNGAPDDQAPAPAGCAAEGRPTTIALVDTGVDARHPALAGRIDRQETLRGPGRRPARTAHGTAVALRLAAAAPGARIVVLDAFHLGPDGEAADAHDLAAALARAAAIGAQVANVSVVGPPNAVVERLGAEAAAGGVTFVVAAGNDGPRAAPLYPAAYRWTVAVTAVDREDQPWTRAAAGPHIAFSAQGVAVPVPLAAAGERRWSGTSFAAPLVAAALAAMPEEGTARIERLASRARDAGPPGRDPVYGWGVVEAPSCDDILPISGSDTAAGG